MPPHLIRGVIGLIHGKVVGVAMLELSNFFHALKWLGVELKEFSYSPGPIRSRDKLTPGNVIKIYNDVMEMCEYFIDSNFWKSNWLNSRRVGEPYNNAYTRGRN